MKNLSVKEIKFIKKNNFSEEEVIEAIEDMKFCKISLIEALELNRYAREMTKYFETEFSCCNLYPDTAI